MTGFQWARPGYECFAALAPTLGRCIFIGLSYWPADRDEIDHLVDALDATAEVIVANPTPPSDFMDRLHAKFESVVEWREAPPTT
jgi:hypothetical protein